MSVPPNFFEQVKKQQRAFLDELITASQLWTKPNLTEQEVLAAGNRVGIEPVLVSEFLVFWIKSGELERSHFTALANAIRRKAAVVIPESFSATTLAPDSSIPKGQTFDLFISHASEDKDAVARPLYQLLREKGLSVWFDEAELTLGDSLRRKIDSGLAKCAYGIVILSPHFMAKEWPQRELDGLVARETSTGEKAILPVWHQIDKRALVRHSPMLADRLAASTRDGIPKVADQILRAVGR